MCFIFALRPAAPFNQNKVFVFSARESCKMIAVPHFAIDMSEKVCDDCHAFAQ